MYTFPYETKRIEEEELVEPLITLEIKTKKGFLTVKFLIDSGADVTTLPLHPYAPLFGFRPNPREKTMIGGVEGSGIAAYPFLLTIRIGKETIPVRSFFIESSVDPLLGRLDVWNRFSITFDNERLESRLTPIK